MKRNAALLAACFLATVPLPSLKGGQFGTGFAVSPKGYLVTCHHVVRDSDRIVAHIGGRYLEANVVALDPQNDLALLKVDHWPGRHLALVSSSEISYASEVLAAGFPDPSVLGTNPKISTGVVNALSGVRDDPRHIQISAPVQPGNSGGPLISSSGRVVGVVAAGLNSIDRMANGGYLPQTVNYAVKADLVLPLLKQAGVPLPKFGTRTASGPRQVERALGSIALIEGLRKGERMLVESQPADPPQEHGRSNTVPVSFPPARPAPWVFPDSHLRPISLAEVSDLPPAVLWRARNEIYVRHGYIFPNEEGRRFAAEFGSHYRPLTPSVEAVQQRLSEIEIANLRLIADFERRSAGFPPDGR